MHHGPLAVVREWADALIVAFVLAMFIRIFMVELFRIPTGSMTPTLIGGRVAELDYDRDGLQDLLYFQGDRDTFVPPLLFLNDGRRLTGQGYADAPLDDLQTSERFDRILVNKLAYWFQGPQRGDIVVFKVPRAIWDPTKPIYIKRCVGEPGERLTFDEQGRLIADGRRVEQPEFFKSQRYMLNVRPGGGEEALAADFDYSPGEEGRKIDRIRVPSDEIYVFGDNTHSSLDSRYWGGVPLERVKGRAFFRYAPLGKMRYLLRD